MAKSIMNLPFPRYPGGIPRVLVHMTITENGYDCFVPIYLYQQTMTIDNFHTVESQVEANSQLLSYSWMQRALRYFGVSESSGNRSSNPSIIQFIATTTTRTYRTTNSLSLREVNADSALPVVCSAGYRFQSIDDSTTPWCSAFVNHVMITSGFGGTLSLGARSWNRWAQRLPENAVLFGAIAVFRRTDPDNPHAGHVGFYYGETGNNYLILGGNQGNRVCVKDYPKADLLSFRWPNVSG